MDHLLPKTQIAIVNLFSPYKPHKHSKMDLNNITHSCPDNELINESAQNKLKIGKNTPY